MKRIQACIAAAIFTISASAMAQTPVPVVVPSQFATAHTIFLAAGGAPAFATKSKVVTNMVFESLYRALSAEKSNKLVAAPADAELSMEVSVVATLVGNGAPAIDLHLVVRDMKTQTMLWVVDEPLEGAFREKTFQRNVDESIAKAMADLRALAAGNMPTP